MGGAVDPPGAAELEREECEWRKFEADKACLLLEFWKALQAACSFPDQEVNVCWVECGGE